MCTPLFKWDIGPSSFSSFTLAALCFIRFLLSAIRVDLAEHRVLISTQCLATFPAMFCR
jgi:hypothetical protein